MDGKVQKKVFHVVVVFYDVKDEFGNFKGVTRVDLLSEKENEKEALAECVTRSKALMQTDFVTDKKMTKEYFFVESIIEKLY